MKSLLFYDRIGKTEMITVYIVEVLVEHPTHALDTTFDYLSKTKILTGVRVAITFGAQKIIGYVMASHYSELTKSELEQEAGFKYRYISEMLKHLSKKKLLLI